MGWFGLAEPHEYRGPFSRWPRITDVVLAAVVFAGSLVAVTASALEEGEQYRLESINELPAGAIALLASAAAALVWRRRRPIAVAVAVMTIMTVWALAGYGDGHDVALVVAIYAVGRYTSEHRHSLIVVAAAIAVSLVGTIIDANQRVDIVPAIIIVGLPWYVGRRVRNRGDYLALLRDRAERLEADQHARARQAVADERARIARELHDVVAHRVSMMTVQAGAAKTIARADLDAAVGAMSDVESAGRQALGELRHLLGILRPDSSAGEELGPQPGVADIPALAEQLSHTGAEVRLTLPDPSDDVTAAVDLSAYRIVQESVTNIIKHAGSNPTVDIAVTLDGRSLVIDITNTTSITSPGLPISGYGLAGMQERAALLGGTLTAEPQPSNMFRVHACLPLHPGPQ